MSMNELTNEELIERLAKYEAVAKENPISGAMYGDILEIARAFADRLTPSPEIEKLCDEAEAWATDDIVPGDLKALLKRLARQVKQSWPGRQE